MHCENRSSKTGSLSDATLFILHWRNSLDVAAQIQIRGAKVTDKNETMRKESKIQNEKIYILKVFNFLNPVYKLYIPV